MNDTTELLPDLKLRFHIEHPDLEECYNEGYDSAVEEMEENANPYKMGSLEYEHWQEGWWAGWYGDERLVTCEDVPPVANEGFYHCASDFMLKFLKLSSALAATAFVGYQILELVA